MTDAATRWAEELAAWALPQHILDAAPSTPWAFPPDLFSAPPPGDAPPSCSTVIARDALAGGGVVLDVGCGGGAAAFALVPPATAVIGTDRQEDMLDLFARTAEERGVTATVVAGTWPDIAAEVPPADVVVCHNVLYNVPDLVPFVAALAEHARRRVVVELTERHPQTRRAPLWRHFWDLHRPEGPTAELAVEALRDAGLPVRVEHSEVTRRDRERAGPAQAAFSCTQLCLPPEREAEVAELLARLPSTARGVTLWWDV